MWVCTFLRQGSVVLLANGRSCAKPVALALFLDREAPLGMAEWERGLEILFLEPTSC